MRIVFLNTWNGRIREPVSNFFSQLQDKTDVFCLQEVYSDGMQPLADSLLPEFKRITAYKRIDNDDFPLSTYVRDDWKIDDWTVPLKDNPVTGLALFAEISKEGKRIGICNVHGISQPGDKLDTQARLEQSKQIIEFMGTVDSPKIIGGDFNLDPDSESVLMFEKAGYRNLMKEYGIECTRNHWIWDKYPQTQQNHSGYAFVEHETKVKSFTVPKLEISDHEPYILEIG